MIWVTKQSFVTPLGEEAVRDIHNNLYCYFRTFTLRAAATVFPAHMFYYADFGRDKLNLPADFFNYQV